MVHVKIRVVLFQHLYTFFTNLTTDTSKPNFFTIFVGKQAFFTEDQDIPYTTIIFKVSILASNLLLNLNYLLSQ